MVTVPMVMPTYAANTCPCQRTKQIASFVTFGITFGVRNAGVSELIT